MCKKCEGFLEKDVDKGSGMWYNNQAVRLSGSAKVF